MDIFGNFSRLKGDKRKRKLGMAEELDFSYTDITLEAVGKVENKESFSQNQSLKAILILLFIIIIGRLFYLQVVYGEANEKLAEGNRIRPRIIEASRGLITDKNGVWLARNEPDFALAVYPSDLPKKKSERDEILNKIAEAAGISFEDIKDLVLKKSKYFLDSVVIKDHISHDESLLLQEKTHGLPGVSIALRSSREYTVLPGLAHILGYTGSVSEEEIKLSSDYFSTDRTGKAGVEKKYEDVLRGKHGVEEIEVDSRGNIVRVLIKDNNRKPVSGNDLTLYLDRDLQQKSAEALQRSIERSRELTGNPELNAGVVIVQDVKTGGILSMVSLPDYNNNLFSKKINPADYKRLIDDKTLPLFNRSIAGLYPPGSVSKIIMAAAGLSEGVINVNTAFDTPLEIKIGEYTFPDWKDHGVTNIERAIAESNNIFFYAIGGGYDRVKGIGIDKIKKWWENFGLGQETGVDLPGEATGLLPDDAWKRTVRKEPWYLGDTYHVAIGQGDLLVTPLQMLNATTTIANGGKLLKPQLVKKVTDPEGNIVEEFGPEAIRDNFVDPGVIRTIQRGMRMTVTEGSARNLQDLPVSVAGKTGTAQFLNNQKTHAWFECFAPYEDPEIAIIVMVEGGGGGYEIAAPVAKEILQYYFTR